MMTMVTLVTVKFRMINIDQIKLVRQNAIKPNSILSLPVSFWYSQVTAFH